MWGEKQLAQVYRLNSNCSHEIRSPPCNLLLLASFISTHSNPLSYSTRLLASYDTVCTVRIRYVRTYQNITKLPSYFHRGTALADDLRRRFWPDLLATDCQPRRRASITGVQACRGAILSATAAPGGAPYVLWPVSALVPRVRSYTEARLHVWPYVLQVHTN